MESVHHVSASSKILFGKVRRIVPPMLEKFHKGLLSSRKTGQEQWIELLDLGNSFRGQVTDQFSGQLGRVAVIGGCAE